MDICANEECEHYNDGSINNCLKTPMVNFCVASKLLTTNTDAGAKLPCSDRLSCPYVKEEMRERKWTEFAPYWIVTGFFIGQAVVIVAAYFFNGCPQ